MATKKEACAAKPLPYSTTIDISRGDLLLAANETLAPRTCRDRGGWRETPLAPGRYDG
ncbi:hypothetical protein KCP73_17970 [Salmonella enterica subsp. enterica]|nr:hypothetical protein KCP73_17970 [Salmonella enterica subsp. enterica]